MSSEVRLIDGNALKIAIDNGWKPDMMVSGIWDIIDEQPTIDVLEKRNEPIKPNTILTTGAGIGLSHCPTCGESIDEYHHPSFCGACGQAVKWE